MTNNFEINKIHNMSNIEGMAKLPDNCIDMTVTSPPYDDLRDYSDPNAWSHEIFKKVADQLYRVTKKGGIVVWVVGDAVIKGGETGSSFKQALYFQELGFKIHDTMIYEKNGSSFPARKDGNRYSQIFEYMFVFSKDTKPKSSKLIIDKPNRWAGFTNFGKAKYRAKDGNLEERKMKPVGDFSARNNIWKYNTGKNYSTKDNIAFEHPAIYPEKLAEDHILTWSNEGDIVLDPFMGSGTTAKMAKLNNRNYIGFELSSDYIPIIEERISDENIRKTIAQREKEKLKKKIIEEDLTVKEERLKKWERELKKREKELELKK